MKKTQNQQTKPVPDGFHTITPHLVIKGAAEAIDFYKRAFGAEERTRLSGPDGKSVMHADITIGDSHVFLVDEFPCMGCQSPIGLSGTPVTIHLYVDDVDTVFSKAVAAGAVVKMPLQDMFWGDRYGKLADPFGHEWALASHKEDVTPEQLQERVKAMFGTATSTSACSTS